MLLLAETRATSCSARGTRALGNACGIRLSSGPGWPHTRHRPRRASSPPVLRSSTMDFHSCHMASESVAGRPSTVMTTRSLEAHFRRLRHEGGAAGVVEGDQCPGGGVVGVLACPATAQRHERGVRGGDPVGFALGVGPTEHVLNVVGGQVRGDGHGAAEIGFEFGPAEPGRWVAGIGAVDHPYAWWLAGAWVVLIHS